jgi:hypothetical protein
MTTAAATPLATLHQPAAAEFRALVEAGRPVRITGGLDGWPALGTWDRAYLRQAAVKEGAALGIFQAARAADWLRPVDGTMPLDEIIDRIWHARADEPFPPGSVYYMKQQPLQKFPGLLKDVRKPLFYPDAIVEVNLWIGGQGSWSPLHFDMADNLMCQVVGTRRVWLYEPGRSRDLYPVFAIGALDDPDRSAHFSMIGDVRAADITRFQRFAGVEPSAAVDLAPGEMLYVPPYWWHHVEIVDGPAVLVNFWYALQYGEPLTREEQDREMALMRELRGLFDRAHPARREAITGVFDALCQLGGRPRP